MSDDDPARRRVSGEGRTGGATHKGDDVGGEFVLVRTRDAGVHCGVLAEYGDGCVLLTDARRVWRWRGANTLHELALRGAAKEFTRISEPVGRITLVGVIEILYPTPAARANLEASRWGE